jgi:hypothetical protein
MKSSTLVNHERRERLIRELYDSWGGDSKGSGKILWRQASREAEHACAAEFGAARGWSVSKSVFGLKTLGAGGVHHHNDYTVDYPVFDHSRYYRSGGPRNRCAAAIVTQPYAVCFSACDRVAEHYGLRWQILENEGWYHPNAFCVVWTRNDGAFKPPLGPIMRKAAEEGDCWVLDGGLSNVRPGISVWFYGRSSEL